MPTYLYKSAKICKALDEVDKDEVFLFTDVDVQYFQPIHQIVEDCMVNGTDIIFQKEFEDIGRERPERRFLDVLGTHPFELPGLCWI